MHKTKTFRALLAVAALFLGISTSARADAVRYRFVDEKFGLSSGGGLQTGTADWVGATVYAVGQVVRNGGFFYKCSVAGTSAASPGPSPNTLTDNTVTWVLGSSAMPTTITDTTAQHELGYIALAKDTSSSDFGIGEFMYVKFTGTTVPGDWVTIDRQGKTAAQTPVAAPGASKFTVIGISMGAQATGNFGWVMIRGVHDQANVTAAGTVGNLNAGINTLGRSTTVQTANYIFDGSVLRAAGVVGTGTVELYWPSCSGR